MYEVQKRCEYTFICYNALFLIVQFMAQGWLPALSLEIPPLKISLMMCLHIPDGIIETSKFSL